MTESTEFSAIKYYAAYLTQFWKIIHNYYHLPKRSQSALLSTESKSQINYQGSQNTKDSINPTKRSRTHLAISAHHLPKRQRTGSRSPAGGRAAPAPPPAASARLPWTTSGGACPPSNRCRTGRLETAQDLALPPLPSPSADAPASAPVAARLPCRCRTGSPSRTPPSRAQARETRRQIGRAHV